MLLPAGGLEGAGAQRGAQGRASGRRGGHSPWQPHCCSIRWRNGEGVREWDGAQWDRNGGNLCRVRSPALR